AQLLQRVLGGDDHGGGDLDLGQRDVELLLDQLLDPLEVVLIVADEDRVGGLVGPHGEPPGQGLGRERDHAGAREGRGRRWRRSGRDIDRGRRQVGGGGGRRRGAG